MSRYKLRFHSAGYVVYEAQPPCARRYVVQPGDTCISIALRTQVPTYVNTLDSLRSDLIWLTQPPILMQIPIDHGEPRTHQPSVHQFAPWRSKSSPKQSFFALALDLICFFSLSGDLSWYRRSSVSSSLHCEAWRHLQLNCCKDWHPLRLALRRESQHQQAIVQ